MAKHLVNVSFELVQMTEAHMCTGSHLRMGSCVEMLWSDPKSAEGRGPSQRGVGVGFGPDVTRSFLEDNQLDLLVRSHEVCHLLAPV